MAVIPILTIVAIGAIVVVVLFLLGLCVASLVEYFMGEGHDL